jgi:hypothetical protein
MVAPAILSPLFFPVRTTHRRQEGALWARRYAKDTVDSTLQKVICKLLIPFADAK